MSERDSLLESIANTTADYRDSDLPAPSPAHVDRWVCQFDTTAQLPMLREMNHVLKNTYFSKEWVKGFFAHQIKHEKLTGPAPCSFWQAAHILDIQQNGHSQSEIRQLFGSALLDQCGLNVDTCGAAGGDYLYIDDVVFTGGRVKNDLSAWIRNSAPAEATIHILVIAAHRLGEWQCIESLKQVATQAGKKIKLNLWAAARIENRKKYRNTSEVLWPAALPTDGALAAYMAQEHRFPFEARQPGGKLEHQIFSSEEGRQLVERELLLAGIRIRGFCQDPGRSLRPLGFGAFGLGFGSTIVTFRNCPNNCPLALWWGDPDAPAHHPFSKWYPLFPRKTYNKEVNFDDIDF